MYEQYDHHGKTVWVRTDLKGKHRKLCLCFACHKFKPGKEDNCPIANDTYQNCVKHGITTPMFECSQFATHPGRSISGEVVTLEECKNNPSLRSNMLGMKVMIRSRQWNAFWRESYSGYAEHAWDAGVFDFADAYAHSGHCGPEKGIEYVIL